MIIPSFGSTKHPLNFVCIYKIETKRVDRSKPRRVQLYAHGFGPVGRYRQNYEHWFLGILIRNDKAVQHEPDLVVVLFQTGNRSTERTKRY